MKKFTLGIMFVFLYCSVSADEKLSLTLKDAIELAIRNNLSLKVEYLNRDIAGTNILITKGEFDPEFGMELSKTYTRIQSPSLVTSSDQRTIDFNTFIEGKMVTGTDYVLAWNNEKFRGDSADLLLNPYYSSKLALTLSQPLLKGFGIDIQKAKVNEAANNYEIAQLGFSDAAEEIVLNTIQAYWDVVSAKNNLQVAELAFKLSTNIYGEVRAKIDTGVLASVEIYKAEAEVAVSEENILNAEKELNDAKDGLRDILNIDDWMLDIETTDIPQETKPVPLLDLSLRNAFASRNDYKSILLEKRNKEILLAFYKNQRMPEINIFGTAGLNGVDGSYSDAIDNLGSGDFYSWEVGISINVPLGNNVAFGDYLKAHYELVQSEEQLREIENSIKLEIREKQRSLELALKKIDAKEKILQAAKKRYEAEEGRFGVGLATLNDVLRFQEEYVKALSDAKNSRIQYELGYADFQKAQGVLMRSLAIDMH